MTLLYRYASIGAVGCALLLASQAQAQDQKPAAPMEPPPAPAAPAAPAPTAAPAPAMGQPPPMLPEPQVAPMAPTTVVPPATEAAPAEEKPSEPFAFGDFTWLNGNSRQTKAVLDRPISRLRFYST